MNKRESLDRSHLVYEDVLDQPTGTHFLIIEDSPMHRSVFSVTGVVVGEHEVVGYNNGIQVVSFSPLFPWKVILNDYVWPITNRELMEADIRDAAAGHKHSKDLRKKYEAEEEQDGPKLSTGQYA